MTNQELKDLVKKAFQKMRNDGFLARMSFSCCNTCGHEELSEKMKNENKKGYIFYPKQSKDDIINVGSVYVQFSGIDDSVESDIDVANHFCDILASLDIPYYWDGSANSAVYIGN